MKAGSVSGLVAVGVLVLAVVSATAQQAPYIALAPDGRASTYQVKCASDCEVDVHVTIYTASGRKRLDFDQGSWSIVGQQAVLKAPLSAYPMLLDSDGVVNGIQVSGTIRWKSNSTRHYYFSHYGESSVVDLVEHEKDLAYVDAGAESGTARIYLSISAPEQP